MASTLVKFKNNNPRFSNNKFSDNNYNNFAQKIPYKITDFNGGLISKDIRKLNFINFANSVNEDVYEAVFDIYIKYLSGDTSFIDDFKFDEDGIDSGYRAERVLDIIKDIRNIKYTKKDYPFILKMNHKTCDTLRFFWSHHNGNLKLLFIDLYHLGIYGNRYIDKKCKPISIERLYKSKKDNKVDLKDIKEM